MRQYQVGATAAVAAVGGYATWYRLGQTWGATDQEQRQALAGDELLPGARAWTTHAITIGALGTLTTHVMARVRLLRLRIPRSDRAPWLLAMAGAMSAAALLRMLGAARPAWLLAAAGCWSLAELLLLAVLARDR